jgi:endo-1,4-beta-xylanase
MLLPRFARNASLALAIAFAHAALWAQTAVPAGGEPLTAADPLAAFRLTTTPGNADAASFRTVDSAGPGFTRAWRVETTRDTGPARAIELRAATARAVAAGDVALIHFFARTLTASDETGGGQIRVAVEKPAPDPARITETQFTVGREWQEFFVPFSFGNDYTAGAAEIAFGFGYRRQVLEIGGCEILHYGARVTLASLPKTRFTYAGREPDAAWRREALARIERIRKSDFTLAVVDAAGAPVRGASIRVEQRRSAFQFGSALQFARLVTDTPDNLRYREKALELFNAASPENDLKWPVWVGDWNGPYNRDQSLRALQWLRDHHFHVRGHVLVYPGRNNLPNSVRALENTPEKNRIPQIVLDHIAEITAATRGLIDEWDVLNEPYTSHELMDLFGRDIMADWFVAARQALPDALLFLNDYSNHDATTDAAHVQDFEDTARFLLEKKAPLTALGLQAHIGSVPNAPAHVLAVLDRYAKFNLPIRITEFDINTDDEQLQADYTRDFMTLMFSYPNVIGFQHWGFWERTHWRPRGAMFRNDWSEKPNAVVYKSLVLDQWRTRLNGRSDAAGKFAARGFHGDYVVTVEAGGRQIEKTFTLRAGEPPLVVDVKLP